MRLTLHTAVLRSIEPIQLANSALKIVMLYELNVTVS